MTFSLSKGLGFIALAFLNSEHCLSFAFHKIMPCHATFPSGFLLLDLLYWFVEFIGSMKEYLHNFIFLRQENALSSLIALHCMTWFFLSWISMAAVIFKFLDLLYCYLGKWILKF